MLVNTSLSDLDPSNFVYEFAKQKCIKLLQKYPNCKVRTVLGDGNCFFRSYLFGFFESFIKKSIGNNSNIKNNLITKLQVHSIELLESQHFSSIVYEDFYEIIKTKLVPLLQEESSLSTLDSLAELFNDTECSNAIIIFFRFITSAFLKGEQNRFEFFVNYDEYSSYESFLRATESLDKEVDQIVVVAFNEWMNGRCRVFIMDNSPSSKFTSSTTSTDELFVEFKGEREEKRKEEVINAINSFDLVPVNLLYRPGHYDLIYLD